MSRRCVSSWPGAGTGGACSGTRTGWTSSSTSRAGNLRDLLRLLLEVVTYADELPVSDRALRRAVAAVRQGFLPIPDDDAAALAKIARTGDPALANVAAMPRLATFLDTHMVLAHTNGREWFDVHPLVRDEVERLASRDATEG